MVRVDVLAFQLPTQPVRFAVPSVIAAPVNEPSIAGMAVPLSALPAPAELANVVVHALCVMHWGALALRSPHPAPLIATE
jgi:hypothetical protein